MSTEVNELPPNSGCDKTQSWSIASREQVQHTIIEFHLKQITSDRIKLRLIVPAPFAAGNYMSVLVR